MAISSHINPERDALLSIERIASSIMQDLGTYQRPSVPAKEVIAYPPLDISFPSDILLPIKMLKIPDEIIQEILQRFYKLFNDLCDSYTTSYKHCLSSAHIQDFETDPSVLQKVFQVRFQRHCLPMVQSHVSSVVSESAKYLPPDVKPTFNSEYTPIFEMYFQFNGYPSAAHRSLLAKKSGMTARQIEVWFQNHRNRSKKEGKVVPRLDSDLPLKQALALLQQEVFPSRIRPPTPPLETSIPPEVVSLRDRSSTFSTHFDDNSSRPPHAFPATKHSLYPDPFPTDNGRFKFLPATWRRKPATVPLVSVAVDMDEFAQTFHLKLNFTEIPRRRGVTPPRSDPPAPQPWYTATITIPPSAPHPALVRTNANPRPVAPVPPLSSNISIFEPIFGSSSLSPSFAIPPIVSRRKTKPLPRRTLTKSRSNVFGSRTSSFSSDISSWSRDSSSPELLTPPPLPNLDLPVLHDGQQDDFFDFSRPELRPNYSLSEFLPSRDFDSPASHPDSIKLVDPFCFDDTYTDFGHNLGEIIY